MSKQVCYAEVLKIQSQNEDPEGKKPNPSEFKILTAGQWTKAIKDAKKANKNVVAFLLGGKFNKQDQMDLAAMVGGDAAHRHQNVEANKDLLHNAGRRRFVGRQAKSGSIMIFAECPGALIEVDGEEKIVHHENCPGIVAIRWANFRERFRDDNCNKIMLKQKVSKSNGDPDKSRLESLTEDHETLVELGMLNEAAKIEAQMQTLKDKIARKALENAEAADNDNEEATEEAIEGDEE